MYFYHSLIFSLALFPFQGLAVPAAAPPAAAAAAAADGPLPRQHRSLMTTTTTPTLPRGRRGLVDSVVADVLNTTKTLETVNGFPNPSVHCSGRSLSDEGDSGYSSDLETAVTSDGTSGLYGTCDVSGDEVDGDGALAWSSGTVQVYYCNHGFAATTCDVNEYWRADALINDKCGAGAGGWVTVSEMSITIGRDPTNSDGSFRSECGYSLHGVNENFAISPNLNTTTRLRR